MNTFTVDRIEEEFIVVTNDMGKRINLPKCFLPDIKEGDSFCVEISDNSEKKEELKKRLYELFERGSEYDK